MDIDATAPVITRDEILIDAPLEVVWRLQTDISAWPTWRPEVRTARLDGSLNVGSVFHWEEGGLQIASAVRELAPFRRIVWTGPAQGIEAVHVWQFTSTPAGVLVHAEESWSGAPVSAQAASLQPLLDGAIRAWLTHLKAHAEAEPSGSTFGEAGRGGHDGGQGIVGQSHWHWATGPVDTRSRMRKRERADHRALAS